MHQINPFLKKIEMKIMCSKTVVYLVNFTFWNMNFCLLGYFLYLKDYKIFFWKCSPETFWFDAFCPNCVLRMTSRRSNPMDRCSLAFLLFDLSLTLGTTDRFDFWWTLVSLPSSWSSVSSPSMGSPQDPGIPQICHDPMCAFLLFLKAPRASLQGKQTPC